MAEEKEKIEEEQEGEASSSSFLNKARGFVARARLSRYLSLGGVLAAIIVYSLLDVGWNPWLIGWEKFIANVALLIFIGVYGIFFGENEGNQRFKNFATGLYKTCILKLRKIVAKISRDGYLDLLPDYIPWRYKKDYEDKCKMKMLSVRLFDPSILDLTDIELENLMNHPIESNGRPYSKISYDQYKVIMDIKQGKVTVDYFDDYTFYTMEDNSEEGKEIVTKVKETPKRKEKITWQQRVSRLFMIFLTALIIAGFFKQQREGDSNATSDLISRLVTLFVSMASGFNTARLLNLEDCFVIKYKISYDKVFYSCCVNGTFKPVDYQQKAKEDYEKYKKEQEKAKVNVVNPDVVDVLKIEKKD